MNLSKANPNAHNKDGESTLQSLLTFTAVAFWAGYIATLGFLFSEGMFHEFYFGLLFAACCFLHTISKPQVAQEVAPQQAEREEVTQNRHELSEGVNAESFA